MKRIVSLILVCVFILSLGGGALAEELPSPNTGTINTIDSGDSLNENQGTVTTNNGTVSTNKGTVGTNSGTISSNGSGAVDSDNSNAVVTTNLVTVTNNYSGATVGTNGSSTGSTGAVVGNNYGTVSTNFSTVTSNFGTVSSNGSSAEGAVNSYAVVETNYGTVEINEGKVAHNYNNGTVDENMGTVSANSGTVKINKGSVTTNDGTVSANGDCDGNDESNANVVIGTNTGTVGSNYGTVTSNGTDGDHANAIITINNGKVGTNYGTINSNTTILSSPDADAEINKQAREKVRNGAGSSSADSNPKSNVDAAGASSGMLQLLAEVDDNRGTINYNAGYVKDNNGTIASNQDAGIVDVNNVGHEVTLNSGIVFTNEGIVGTNDEYGFIVSNDNTVTENKGLIQFNTAEVTTNAKDGLIIYNSGTVETNYGTIGEAEGGSITNNYGTEEKADGTTYVGTTVNDTDGEGGSKLEQFIQGIKTSLSNLFKRSGYNLTGYTLHAASPEEADVTCSGTDYTAERPGTITLLWAEAPKPAPEVFTDYYYIPAPSPYTPEETMLEGDTLKLSYNKDSNVIVTEELVKEAVISSDGAILDAGAFEIIFDAATMDFEVVFSEDFLKTLSPGMHTITIVVCGNTYTFTILI